MGAGHSMDKGLAMHGAAACKHCPGPPQSFPPLQTRVKATCSWDLHVVHGNGAHGNFARFRTARWNSKTFWFLQLCELDLIPGRSSTCCFNPEVKQMCVISECCGKERINSFVSQLMLLNFFFQATRSCILQFVLHTSQEVGLKNVKPALFLVMTALLPCTKWCLQPGSHQHSRCHQNIPAEPATGPVHVEEPELSCCSWNSWGNVLQVPSDNGR